MGIDGLIGNTPLIKIVYNYKGETKSVYAKLETCNLTGSIKDRIAYYIIKEAMTKGLLYNKQPIIEVSNGNTGISFAAIGSYFKYPVHIFIPDDISEEKKKLMEMYGAHTYTISKEKGRLKKAIKEAKKLAKEISGFFPNQFESMSNINAHYNGTAIEIINEFPDVGGFVSGIGTGGTLIGVGKRLKEYNHKIKVYGLKPDSLSLLTADKKDGSHKIEGIEEKFIPSIVDKKIIDEVILINDMDAINMARKFAQRLGLGIGISSGANFLASVIVNRNDDIVTIFVDDNKKYLNTDLCKNIDDDKELLSNSIELIKIETMN